MSVIELPYHHMPNTAVIPYYSNHLYLALVPYLCNMSNILHSDSPKLFPSPDKQGRVSALCWTRSHGPDDCLIHYRKSNLSFCNPEDYMVN